MSSMDAETFARLFSGQYADFKQDVPLWQRLAREAGSPILEIGCGAGRVLRVLARDGFEITGIDTNPAMLRRAGEGLSEGLRRRVRLIEQDVRSLDLRDRYRLILAPCNALAGLADGDLAQALSRLQAHLRPQGILAFEAPCPGQAEEEVDPAEPLAAFLEPESGNPVQVYATQRTEPDSGSVEVTWRYDELQPDGTVRSCSLPTTFRVRHPEGYAPLLTNAGFAGVSFHGGYNLEPLGPDSLQLIVVAHA
jgi:SAM-dependent methyltransferase